MHHLAFADCAEILRMNGYTPAPLSPETGRPIGPYAVMQIPYERHASNAALPVGVLTAVPLALSPDSPVQNAQATWLATITVRVRADVAAEVDATLQRYTGGNCPARVEDDGARRYVLRLAGERFFTCQTDDHDGDYVRASAGPDFVPIAGEWSPAGGLLVVQRGDLPEIDYERAAALVEAVNELLYQHAPPVAPPPRYVPKPLPNLATGEQLLFGNVHARSQLQRNDYHPCAVAWGDTRPSDKWYLTASIGVQWDAATDDMGVGLFTRSGPRARDGLAAVEMTGRADLVARVDAAIVRRVGPGLLRVASDGSRLRLFSTAPHDWPKDSTHVLTPDGSMYVPGSTVRVRFVSDGAIVVAGWDAAGEPFTWPEGDPLTVPRGKLPNLSGAHLIGTLDALRAAMSAPETPLAVEGAGAIAGRRKARA